MYKLTNYNGFVINLETKAFIPDDPANPQRKEYEAWIASGNEPERADPSLEPVSAAQAKLALYNAGLYGAVTEAVSQVGYEPIRIYFDNANEWERSHPHLMGLAAELSLTEEQVDALFESARQL